MSIKLFQFQMTGSRIIGRKPKYYYYNKPNPADVALVREFEQHSPRDLGLEVVTIGDQSHQHQFVKVLWDRERFGSDFADPDPDPGTPIAFPMATYKDLLRCNCGAEAVKSVRALI